MHNLIVLLSSACSRAGRVDEGCYCFNQMISEYNIKPRNEHYSCLIDLLGGIGRLDEAYGTLQGTPEFREGCWVAKHAILRLPPAQRYRIAEEIAKLLIEKILMIHQLIFFLLNFTKYICT